MKTTLSKLALSAAIALCMPLAVFAHEHPAPEGSIAAKLTAPPLVPAPIERTAPATLTVDLKMVEKTMPWPMAWTIVSGPSVAPCPAASPASARAIRSSST